MGNKRTGQDYLDYEKSTSKGKCSDGTMTMEIRYDKDGNMTDSCGNRIGPIEKPKPYNPNTDKFEAVPLKSKRRRR